MDAAGDVDDNEEDAVSAEVLEDEIDCVVEDEDGETGFSKMKMGLMLLEMKRMLRFSKMNLMLLEQMKMLLLLALIQMLYFDCLMIDCYYS